MDQSGRLQVGELLEALREQAGLDLAALVPADRGESARVFLATGWDGTVSVLKVSRGATGESVARVRDLAARLRRRGYPAARVLASGQVADVLAAGAAARRSRRPGPGLAASRGAAAE